MVLLPVLGHQDHRYIGVSWGLYGDSASSRRLSFEPILWEFECVRIRNSVHIYFSSRSREGHLVAETGNRPLLLYGYEPYVSAILLFRSALGRNRTCIIDFGNRYLIQLGNKGIQYPFWAHPSSYSWEPPLYWRGALRCQWAD